MHSRTIQQPALGLRPRQMVLVCSAIVRLGSPLTVVQSLCHQMKQQIWRGSFFKDKYVRSVSQIDDSLQTSIVHTGEDNQVEPSAAKHRFGYLGRR